MKDCSDEILTAVYTILNGNCKYGATNWPVYTIAPFQTDPNYVILNNPDIVSNNTKDGYISECSLLIEIVSAWNQRGTFKAVNDVGSDIMVLLVNQTWSMTSFNVVVKPEVTQNTSFTEVDGLGYIVRKLIRFTFVIAQK